MPVHYQCSSPWQSTANYEIVYLWVTQGPSDLNISNMLPKELSYGIDEIFPIFISLVTRKHKRHRQISTKMAQTDCINAQMNQLPTQVNKFTLQRKKKKKKRINSNQVAHHTILAPQWTSSHSGRNQQNLPTSNRVPKQIGLSYKGKAQTEGEMCFWCAHWSNLAYKIGFINLQHKRIHKSTNKQTCWTGYQSGFGLSYEQGASLVTQW